MPDDWKGEHLIRNVPRDMSRLSRSKQRKQAATAREHTKVCANDDCSVFLSNTSTFDLCPHCRRQRRKKHAPPETIRPRPPLKR